MLVLHINIASLYFVRSNLYPLILYSILHLLFHSPYRKSLVCFLSLWVCFFFVIFTNFIFKILHTNDILQYFSFSVWFILLGIILSKSIHVVVNGRIFFLYFIPYTYMYLYICIYISIYLTSYSFIYWWTLGCFHILAIINNAVINIGVHVSFWFSVFVFFGYIPRTEISGSYGNSIFSFLRNLHTVFHGDCPYLCSHWQCMRVFFSPYPCQNLLFMVFLMIVILTCVRWHIVILICICQMINDVEHLFTCLLAICMSSLKKMFIQFFCLLLNWAFKKILSWMSYLYVLDINSLLVITFANIFSHLVGCLSILSMISFAAWKLLSLIRSHLFIFDFISFALRRQIQKKYYCNLCQRVIWLCSFKSSIVSSLTFRALIHSEFIFVYDVRKCSNFILLHVAIQCFKKKKNRFYQMAIISTQE